MSETTNDTRRWPPLARVIQEMATERFATHGGGDARGAAIWDVACFIAEKWTPIDSTLAADLTAQRDQARRIAVALEQEVAELTARLVAVQS